MLSELSQTEKDKHRIISLTCGIQKPPEFIDMENRLVVARGGGRGYAKQEKRVKGAHLLLSDE